MKLFSETKKSDLELIYSFYETISKHKKIWTRINLLNLYNYFKNKKNLI